jgi:hypothetical protein
MPNLDALVAECDDTAEDIAQYLSGFKLVADASRISSELRAEALENVQGLTNRADKLAALKNAALEALAAKSFEPPLLTASEAVIAELKKLLGELQLAANLLVPPVELPIDASAEQDA